MAIRRASAATHRRRKIPRQAVPTAIQHELGNALASRVALARAAFDAKKGDLARAVKRGDVAGAHAIVERAATVAEATVAGHTRVFAGRVDQHNRRELGKQLKAGLGADVAMPPVDHRRVAAFSAAVDRDLRKAIRSTRDMVDKHVAKMLDAAAHAERHDARRVASRADAEFPIEHALEHVNLISGLTKTEREQLAAELAAAHATGDLTEGLVEIILREGFDMAETRARSIARDQVAKLNGQVNADRQIALGITHFRWVTRLDDRVRKLHKERHGKIYEWANPPTTSGNASIPGSDFNCRCDADPVLEDVRVVLGGAPRAPGTREAPALFPVRRLT